MIALQPDARWASTEARSFPCELDSARAARHYVTAALDGADEKATDEAAIICTELAANAVLHACSAFTLTVSRSAGRVRITVADHAALEDGDLQVKPGHGLSVVTQLAARWGVDRRPGGKVVWVELPMASPQLVH